ncbi:hypothetical protein Pfo_010954 [Paulownia fortunei]|nr:hypothetical protein Pfo_010954 [Paulownia fortunei]
MVVIEESPTAETVQKSPPDDISTSALAEGYNSDGYETASETELNDAHEEQADDNRSRNDIVSNGGDISKVGHKQPPQSNQDEEAQLNEVLLLSLKQANAAKLEGNTLFKDGLYEEALIKYELALQVVQDGLSSFEMRSICHANRAACLSKLIFSFLADMTKILELDPSQGQARRAIIRKLKEMGNSILGHFGMSVDNFKAVKDPNTGSYSISFQN